MDQKPIAAIMYDFDGTLSPGNMQEYGFFEETGLTPDEFWARCEKRAKEHDMDQILAYMLEMKLAAKGKVHLTRNEFNRLGSEVRLYEGVKDWFSRINNYAAAHSLMAEHYIISSGLKEIIEGTPIAQEFKEIYAASYCYDEHGSAIWPAMAVNYTSKTQFLYRINKGVLSATEHTGLNEFTPESARRVPFRNMIYVGDGFTDVPCMKIVRQSGGHAVAVYSDTPGEPCRQLLKTGRVDFIAPADYTEGSDMERTVFAVLDKIAANEAVESLRRCDFEYSDRLTTE